MNWTHSGLIADWQQRRLPDSYTSQVAAGSPQAAATYTVTIDGSDYGPVEVLNLAQQVSEFSDECRRRREVGCQFKDGLRMRKTTRQLAGMAA